MTILRYQYYGGVADVCLFPDTRERLNLAGSYTILAALIRAVLQAVIRDAVWRTAVTSFAAATGPLVDFMVGFFAGVLLIRDFLVIAIVVSPELELNFFTPSYSASGVPNRYRSAIILASLFRCLTWRDSQKLESRQENAVSGLIIKLSPVNF